MSFTFLNTVLLVGLLAVIIPPIIHLLNRRRFDVVDWGAMRFLRVSQRVRRKVFIEELLLMLMRMGLIAVLVMALAAPILSADWIARYAADRTNRDVVLVFDGSASLGYVDDGQTGVEAAREWAGHLLDELATGDGVGAVWGGSVPGEVIPVLYTDFDRVRAKLADLPTPESGTDAPAALQAALEVLTTSTRPAREIVVLTDGQRHGWANERTLEQFKLLAAKVQLEGGNLPRIWIVNVVPSRPESPPNAAIGPLTSSRPVGVIGRAIRFRTNLHLSGDPSPEPPKVLRIEIDGRPAGDERLFTGSEGGLIPLSFERRFDAAGVHLLSVSIPDDEMPGDNRQDIALEVVRSIPVLMVDGDPRTTAVRRGSDFLEDALAPKRDPSPAFLMKVVPLSQFDPAMLARDLGTEKGTQPRVLILSDVPTLSPEQQEGVAKFAREGGGVLVTLGRRAQTEFYNTQLFQGGEGWLPAELVETTGDVNDVEGAPTPVAESFNHPVVEPFGRTTQSTLTRVRFPRHWRLTIPEGTSGTSIAMLSDRDPFLVERSFGKGRVIVASVPFDNSWQTNLTTLPDFPRLAHELGYYLSGTSGLALNLEPGQPILFRPANEESPSRVTVELPNGEKQELPAQPWPAIWEDTRRTGVYKVSSERGSMRYYVVQPDAGESVLTRFDEDSQDALREALPTAEFAEELDQVAVAMRSTDRNAEVWPWFMALVVALLCGEILMTRRIALRGGGVG